jgi:hypothetical protein
MEVIVISDYITLTKIDGKLTSIQINHNGVWHDLPFNAATQTLDESHPLTIELRQWEAENGVVVETPQPPPPPNWIKLTNSLRGTELFAKVYNEAKINPQVAVPFNLLVSTLNSVTPNLNDLTFSLREIKALMGEKLTQSDIEFVNQVLADNFFPFTI